MLVWLSLRYRLNTEYLPQVIERVPDFPIVIWALICYTFGETADNGSSGSRTGDPVSVRGSLTLFFADSTCQEFFSCFCAL